MRNTTDNLVVYPRTGSGKDAIGWRGTTMSGLFAYLDRAEKKQGHRVIKILNLMLELQPTKKYEKVVDGVHKKLLLDRELSKFRFCPDLYPIGRDRWTLGWRILSRGSNPLTRFDTAALQLILQLAAAGKLNRLRKCSECSQWMYAKFRHQVFCSTACQQRHYRHSDKWKQNRREYMRKYRSDRFPVDTRH
jgi:hypothetical protein